MTAALIRIGNGFFYYLPVVLLIIAWDLSSRSGLLSQDLAPSPGETFDALVTLWTSGDITRHAGISLFRELSGLLLSIAAGIVIGIGMARIEWVRILIRPSVTFLYPMPKSALIPILLLWFGLGHMSKVAAVFLGCLLPMVISSYNGARGVEPQLVWSARSLGASRSRVLWKIIFMAALPDIMSGARIALALSWLLLVSAEMMISQNGLGYLVAYYGETGDYANMFAGVATVIALGYFSDRLFLVLMRRLLRWRST
jgi:ABC-type nitrate/sulfonate/bicarbonate transport system permease component